MRRIVDGRRADAVIVVRTRRDDERVALLAERGVPFVTHGRTGGTIAHAFIDGDGEAGFAAATKDLAALGHKRIAHLAAPLDLSFGHWRHRGWLRAMGDHGFDSKGLSVVCEPNETAGHAAASHILKAPDVKTANRPTALLCATDAIAIGAMKAAREAGLLPGLDIAIVGHDNLPAGRYMDPQLTTMEIDVDDLGGRLAELLLKRLGGTAPEELQTLLPVRQIPRASHGGRLGANRRMDE